LYPIRTIPLLSHNKKTKFFTNQKTGKNLFYVLFFTPPCQQKTEKPASIFTEKNQYLTMLLHFAIPLTEIKKKKKIKFWAFP